MRQSLSIVVLFLAAGLVVLAAGCGGGSKSSAPPTTGATTTTMTTTGGNGNFANAKNCLEFAGLAAQIAKAINPTGSSSPQKAEQELQALANAAPSDIKGDLQTIASAFSGFLQAVQNSGYTFGSTAKPTPLQLAAITSAAHSFGTTKFVAAERRLGTWEKQNCPA